MKKFLLILIGFLAGLGVVHAQTYKWTAATNDFTKGVLSFKNTADASDVLSTSWTLTKTGSGTFGSVDATKGQQIGTANSPITGLTMSTSAFADKTISAITINASTASKGTAVITAVTVGGNAFDGTGKLTTTPANYAYTGSASGDIEIKFTNTAAAFYVKSIEITYTAGSSEVPQVGEITFTPASGTTLYGSESVSIACATPDAEMMYTLGDVTDIYSGPITLPSEGTHTINVIASKAGMTDREASATFTYVATKLTTPEFGFAKAEDTAYLGAHYALPTLTNSSDNKSVAYSVNPEGIVNIAADGTVSLLREGNVTITASIAATDTYQAASASFRLTVTDPNKIVDEITGTSSYNSSYTSKSTLNGSNGIQYIVQAIKNGSNIQIRANTTGIAVSNNPNGYFVKSVDVKWAATTSAGRSFKVYGSNDPYTAFSNITSSTLIGTYSFTAAGDVATITPDQDYKYIAVVGNGDVIYLASISISWKAPLPDAVEKPAIQVADNFIVTLTCPTEGTSIYYTLDGSTPSASSTLYSKPFALKQNCTIKAIAIKDADSSKIAETTVSNMPQVGEITFTPASGTTLYGSETVSIACATPDAEMLYEMGDVVDIYAGPITLPSEGTHTIHITASKAGMIDREASATFTYVAVKPLDPCAAVTASVANNATIYGSTPIELACATPDATITYSLSGPAGFTAVENATYSTPLTLSLDGEYILSATASKEGMANGPEFCITFTYAAKHTAPAVSISPASNSTLYTGDAVTVTCPEGFTAVYSLDGSDFIAYNAPIILNGATNDIVTVQARAIADGYYDGPVAEASYEYIAGEKPIEPVLFDFNKNAQEITLSKNGTTVTSGQLTEAQKGDITLSFSGPGTATNFYTSNNTLRVYSGNTMTVGAPAGYKLDKIEISLTTSMGFEGYTATVAATAPQITWTADPTADPVSAVDFKATATNQITQILVTYSKILPKIEPVTFTPDGGDIWGNASVTLNCSTADASILYRVNDEAEQPYTGPITFATEGSYTITAHATKSGMRDSEPTTATFHYFFEQPIPPCPAVTFSPNVNTLFDTDKVALDCTEPGATITYSINGGEAVPYTAPFGFTTAGVYEVVATSAKEGMRTTSTAVTFTYDPYRHTIFSFDSEAGRAEIEFSKDGTPVTDAASTQPEIDKAVKNNIVLNFTDGGNPTKYFSGDMRIYKDGALSVSVPATQQVKKVIISTTQGSFIATEGLSAAGTVLTWATTDDYVQAVGPLTIASAVRITSIEVCHTAIPYVAQCAPVEFLNADPDFVSGRDMVTLAAPTPLSRIKVKLEGTDALGAPSVEEFDYAAPFTIYIPGTTTITATAMREGSDASNPVTFTYEVRNGKVQKFVDVLHWQELTPATQYVVYYQPSLGSNSNLFVASTPTSEPATGLPAGTLHSRQFAANEIDIAFDGKEFREEANAKGSTPLIFTLEAVAPETNSPATWHEAIAQQYRLKVVGQDSYLNLTPGAALLSAEGSIVTLHHESDCDHPEYSTVVIADAQGNTLGYDIANSNFGSFTAANSDVCTKLYLNRISSDESKELNNGYHQFDGEAPEYNFAANRRGFNLDQMEHTVTLYALPKCELYYRCTPVKYFDKLPVFGVPANHDDNNYSVLSNETNRIQSTNIVISKIGSIDYFQQRTHSDGTILRSPVHTIRYFDEQTTQITELNTEIGSAPLFNLQGRRVMHPTIPGLYISGSKVIRL